MMSGMCMCCSCASLSVFVWLIECTIKYWLLLSLPLPLQFCILICCCSCVCLFVRRGVGRVIGFYLLLDLHCSISGESCDCYDVGNIWKCTLSRSIGEFYLSFLFISSSTHRSCFSFVCTYYYNYYLNRALLIFDWLIDWFGSWITVFESFYVLVVWQYSLDSCFTFEPCWYFSYLEWSGLFYI